MDSSISQIVIYVLGSAALGAACGWLIQARISKRRIAQITNDALRHIDDASVQRDQLANKYSRLRAKIEPLQSTLAERRSKYKSLHKKSNTLAKSVLSLRSEREDTKLKLSTLQNALVSLKKRTAALQSEFEKTQAFYKRELTKSLQQRKQLEKDAIEARAEQESFANMLESSTLEHGSTENMVVAAQLRLGQIKVLERNVSKLEEENAQLGCDIVRMRHEFAERDQNISELEQLRIHNKELVRCVEALEGRRSEHETDAERYRQQADESEKLSDTLRIKLNDLEKNFAAIEKQQDEALEDARKAAVVPMLSNRG